MPLHPNQEPGTISFDPFHDPVLCPGNRAQALPQPVDSLMMVRSDAQSNASDGLSQPAAGCDGHGVAGVGAHPIAMRCRIHSVREMLLKPTAERHVQHLHASTGTENREAPGNRGTNQKDLELVSNPKRRIIRGMRAFAIQ